MTGAAKTRWVALIGFMGAGKTTVGRALAQRLGWTFCDLDELIEAREQKTVAEIFARAGEDGFRKMESALLMELLKNATRANCVIALGGGTFVQPQNRSALQKAGAITILLEAPLDELKRRCREAGRTRPLALDEEHFEQLFAGRRADYALAQLCVNTGSKTPEQVATEIESLLQDKRLKEYR
ncbi:MAG TPA: shikimate kinase [Alphaproteobacteria bacterium]|nr:shikimate kinase [Alphaproteobacteria bacterium]